MDNNSDEVVINFSQIWAVTKKAIARAAIYIVVSVIVCFAVLYTFRSLTKENYYSASITFKQSDDSISTTLDNNKATAVSTAVNTVFGDSENATEIYESVLKSLSINPYIPEENEDDTTYIATTYTVELTEMDVDGVTSAQKVTLLENICTELIYAYSEVSSPDGILSTQAWGYTADYTLEYLDVINEISSRLSTLQTTLNANIAANTAANSKFETYKSTSAEQGRRTAAEIVASLDNVATTVSSISDSIISNGISNTNASLSGTDYCDATIAILNANLVSLNYLKTSYEKQITDLADVITNGSAAAGGTTGTTVVVDYSSYTSLVESLMSVESRIASINGQIANTELLKTNISANTATNAANMTTIESAINTVITDIESILEDYNDLVTEFKASVMPSSYASISKSAYAYSSSPLSLMVMLIVLVAVAVIAFAVAFGQTWSILKKTGKMDELMAPKPLPLASGNE